MNKTYWKRVAALTWVHFICILQGTGHHKNKETKFKTQSLINVFISQENKAKQMSSQDISFTTNTDGSQISQACFKAGAVTVGTILGLIL